MSNDVLSYPVRLRAPELRAIRAIQKREDRTIADVLRRAVLAYADALARTPEQALEIDTGGRATHEHHLAT